MVVWELHPNFTQLFYDCLSNHIDMQIDPNTVYRPKGDVTIDSRQDMIAQWRCSFRFMRTEWKKPFLESARRKMEDDGDELNEFYRLLYLDAKSSLKVLYNVRPPQDLNDLDEVDAWVDENIDAVQAAHRGKMISKDKEIGRKISQGLIKGLHSEKMKEVMTRREQHAQLRDEAFKVGDEGIVEPHGGQGSPGPSRSRSVTRSPGKKSPGKKSPGKKSPGKKSPGKK